MKNCVSKEPYAFLTYTVNITLPKNKTLNNILSSLLSTFPIFTSLTAYRNSHLDHHRYLSDREKDPDTKRYKLFGLDKPG
ncbi:hypothetical protein D9C11_12805 [Bacillus subtilis subsp. subtilis]|nr:hypothetical protein D9C11_12805 [Bacillus subtilis subsp. subtilis]